MDDEVALEFAADVEEAVAAVRDLAANAQELAGVRDALDGAIADMQQRTVRGG